nr:hypothetical protein [Tanacetum cinerariifolium]
MIVEQQVATGADKVHDEGVPAAGIVDEGDVSVVNDVVPTADEEPSIPSPTPPTPPPQPSQDVSSTSQIHLTPPQSPQAQPRLPQHQPQPLQDAGLPMDLLQTLMDTYTTLTRRVEHLEQDKVAQALEITKLKSRVKKLERRNKASKLKRLKRVRSAQRINTSDDTFMDDVSKQGGIIKNIDGDEDVVLEDAKDVVAEAKDGQVADVKDNADIQGRTEESKPIELQEVVDVVTTAKIITEVVTAASTTITAANVPIPVATTAVAASTLTTVHSRRRKGVRKQKEDKSVKIYQALKRKPQTEAQARKNMMVYLKNVAGFKMDYFKGMSYDDIHLIFEKHFDSNVAFLQKTKEQMDEEDNRALKRLNESKEEKAAKKQKLDEEIEELKRHLQIISNDEDDVYTEPTPLAQKVPVVDYEIYNENNKPYYKIKRADGSHQLYLSFLSLLGNFNREDLEVLWSLVKERFTTTKPKNFSDDFLLITLGAIFDGHPSVMMGFLRNKDGVGPHIRYHSGDGYHAVPPPYIGTFMPPKPDLVLHNAPNVNETDHTAFNVAPSPTKPDKDLSHTYRPLEPGNPQHALKGKGVIDSGCSRHMTGTMSYMSNFEELNSGYVSFGGNTKGGNQSNPSAGVQEQFDVEKAREDTVQQYVLFPVCTNTFSAASPSNTAGSPTHENSSYVKTSQYLDDQNIPELEDITYSDDEEDVGAEVDFTNLETTITVTIRQIQVMIYSQSIDYNRCFNANL